MKKIPLLALCTLLCSFWADAFDEGYLPLVREGVQWVNERIIINHCDTTRYYYKYEFKGVDTETNTLGDINQACYYYTGETLDIEQDSLIAGLREEGSNGFYNVTCFRNNAYNKVEEDQMNLLHLPMLTDGGTRILYWFGDYSDYNRTVDFYLMLQDWVADYEEPFLTADNFTTISPIEIEGVECTRCAYVNEQGDTMCYVVEGIGFDSYDMGDLLTPFTRKPDPDAYYQEYCGLSHVMMDGQIIYKGMRYDEQIWTGINEMVADQRREMDGNYYDLMGRAVGKELPTAPGIYIHHGKKIVVR